MPPKAKFTKQKISETALSIIENNGIEALTARSLGSVLGSSPRPIFTVFNSMDEVITETAVLAKKIYSRYVADGLTEEIAFKGVGKSYIRFASEHPKLFQLLFMKEQNEVPNLLSVLGIIEENYDKILRSIVVSYNVDTATAEYIYKHLWIYSHGIAVLIATKVCYFTAEQISNMLTEVFTAIMEKIKRGENI